MLKVKIGEKEFEYLTSLETEEYYNGSSRRTLTVNCPSDAIGLDELNALLTEENLAEIVMTNTEGISVYKDVLAENEEGEMVPTGEQEFDHFDPIVNYFDGYVLKLSCGITSVPKRLIHRLCTRNRSSLKLESAPTLKSSSTSWDCKGGQAYGTSKIPNGVPTCNSRPQCRKPRRQ